jgi:hypothetical protein
VQSRVCELVCELELFEVGVADCRERGEQRGTREDCSIVNGVPDGSAGAFDVGSFVDLLVLVHGVEVADVALAAVEVGGDTAVTSAIMVGMSSMDGHEHTGLGSRLGCESACEQSARAGPSSGSGRHPELYGLTSRVGHD